MWGTNYLELEWGVYILVVISVEGILLRVSAATSLVFGSSPEVRVTTLLRHQTANENKKKDRKKICDGYRWGDDTQWLVVTDGTHGGRSSTAPSFFSPAYFWPTQAYQPLLWGRGRGASRGHA